MWLENMRFLDALYMTVITVSTVGFREVKDLSDIGKLWTIILIIFGWGTVSILITNVAAYFLSLEVFKRRYGMPKGISDHYIICGFGRMGKDSGGIPEKLPFPFYHRGKRPRKG